MDGETTAKVTGGKAARRFVHAPIEEQGEDFYKNVELPYDYLFTEIEWKQNYIGSHDERGVYKLGGIVLC